MRNTLKICAMAVLAFALAARADDDDDHAKWFSAWTVSTGAQMGPTQTGANFAPDASGTTLRIVTRPSISGKAVRVRIENTLSTTPSVFSGAYIGKVASGAALVPGSKRRLTFSGRPGISLAAGGAAWSDPVRFEVNAFDRLAVSLEVVSAPQISGHQLGLTTNFIAPGAVGGSTAATGFAPVPQNAGNYPVYFVAAVDVQSSKASGTIVTLGDSITDGRCSTRDPVTGDIPADVYNRWTDVLAMRLHALYGDRAPAVANEGIAGNRVVLPNGNGPSALTRLKNDVIDRAGLRWVIFYEGTNDITGGATVDQLKAGMQSVVDQLHTAGAAVYGAPVIPRGRPDPMTGWNASMEDVKLKINHWMLNESNLDAFIDFHATMSGPIVIEADHLPAEAMWSDWACFDFTHPNKFGYPAIGHNIDLGLFR